MAMGQADGSIISSTKVDTKGIKGGMSSIVKLGAKAGKAMAVAFSVKKVYDFVKASVNAFAEYEQLIGGVETLFKDSADKVMKYANEAYRTTGLSANEYMATVTSFSASLLDSLGGDTAKAADVANEALISMADNANKMGSSIESIQTAFQGFAKGQYMLLDNLKLGYGGTKTEMERLLKDAEAITGVKYDISNLADVYTAIGVIQEKLGIAGTTAKEASTTISGSAAMMKSAWQNVLTAMSGGGDLGQAIDALVESIEIYFDNILPVIEKAIEGLGRAIERIAPRLTRVVANAFVDALPDLIKAVEQMIIGLIKGIGLAVAELFSGKTNEILKEQAEAIEKSAESQEQLTDNVKDTNDELKKSLAGFDDIQILTSQAAEDTNNTELPTPDGGGSSTSGVAEGTVENKVSAVVTAIEVIVGTALFALGVVLLCYGQIHIGVGLMAAGAFAYTSAVVSNWELIVTKVNGVLKALRESIFSSIAIFVLGVVLLFAGLATAGAFGLILPALAVIATPVAAHWDFISEKIKDIWEKIKNYWNSNIKPALDAAFAYISPKLEKLKDALEELWNEVLHPFLNWVGKILLWLWVTILKPILKWIEDKLLDAAEGAIDFIAKAIGFVIDALTATINLVVALKHLWNDAWSAMGKITKSVVNGIINALNKLIEGMNKISFNIPDWDIFGDLKNKSFGLNIPKIPKLAQGAVIPPNREFLAVLGDQRSGTNIETPLSTMVEAFQMALDSRGNSMTREEHYYLNETELMKIMYRLAKGGERISGTSLVSGGGY
jgi:phage-related protein